MSKSDAHPFKVIVAGKTVYFEHYQYALQFAEEHSKGSYEIWEWDPVEGAYMQIT